MSFIEARLFFRERLEGLGYTEHDQPFQPTQLGESIQDMSFHLETGSILGAAANQKVHSFLMPVTVRIYRKAYQDVLEAYDQVHRDADAILSDILDPFVRIGTIVKDVIPDSIQPLPLDDSNDNVIVLELVFTAKLENCYA